jgi:hypothetical protein
LEIFPFVNGLAAHCDMSVSLLNVITLNILAPETRLYDELAADARFHLECIAGQYLPTATSKTIHVRFGKPAEELLKQSREEPVDLVVLANDGCSFLCRLMSALKSPFNPKVSPLIERLVRERGCEAIVISSRTQVDCETIWGRARQSTQRYHRLAHVMRFPKLAQKATSQAEGLEKAFSAEKHVCTAYARGASARQNPTARDLVSN